MVNCSIRIVRAKINFGTWDSSFHLKLEEWNSSSIQFRRVSQQLVYNMTHYPLVHYVSERNGYCCVHDSYVPRNNDKFRVVKVTLTVSSCCYVTNKNYEGDPRWESQIQGYAMIMTYMNMVDMHTNNLPFWYLSTCCFTTRNPIVPLLSLFESITVKAWDDKSMINQVIWWMRNVYYK